MALRITILGAGVTGLTVALALRKHLPDPKPDVTIYEIRDTPSSIGGAVNLTPKALRYLDYLGIDARQLGAECRTIDIYDLYSGTKYSEVDFQGPEGNGVGRSEQKRFFSSRVMRRELQAALLKAVKDDTGIKIVWGKQVSGIKESNTANTVRLTFTTGEETTSDLLLGCDGIHSAARTLFVEPDRRPTYTGIAVVMATATIPAGTKLKWETTGLTSSRRGSFMASYFESTRKEQYVAVVMEIAEVADREGWKIRGSDQEAIKADILERFRNESMPELADLTEAVGEWSLYPVFKLPPRGQWTSPGGRCILLGDAAHAMPPQGESTGICIEDAIVFSRAMINHKEHPFQKIFGAYEDFRRSHIDAAYTQAVQRWETVKDSGSLVYKMKTLLTPWILWWTAKAREDEFSVDYTDYDFKL